MLAVHMRLVATCAAPGCGNTVPPGQVMCSDCALSAKPLHTKGT